ncbi:MAG: RpiB/LacA/LacB family sugar-phosphate isomerase, partial [Fastidiosipila sp.]|nr:RpiB/LacA/LacB family sugar-phosphate isomerase [Fastidiosipila sp.]
MKIAIGCDPNAAELKKIIIELVEDLGHEVTDMGSDDPIYANVAAETARRVASKEFDRGIVICGTGIGVSIAANKVKGAYCALLN